MTSFWRRLRRQPPEPEHLRAGKWGEMQAAGFLRQKGYQLIGQRVQTGRREEIDLVVRDGKDLVFVEVKTRRNESFGSPSAAVDRKKRIMQSRAAIHYLKSISYPAVNFRFDIVEVIGMPDDVAAPVIRHIERAFPLDKRYRIP